MTAWFEEESVTSTNVLLREKVRQGEVSTAVMWAQEQTAGRGRLDRHWLSPEGGLFLSLSTQVPEGVNASFFGAIAGVAAVEWIRKTYTEKVFLKWPNDLVVVEEDQAEKKLGGILAEFLSDAPHGPHVVVGLGINVNASVILAEGDTSLTPTALHEHTTQNIDLKAFAQEVAQQILSAWKLWTEQPDTSLEWAQRWKECTCTLGRKVRIQMQNNTLTGIARDITPALSLLLEDEQGHTQEVHSGDCIHLRPA